MPTSILSHLHKELVDHINRTSPRSPTYQPIPTMPKRIDSFFSNWDISRDWNDVKDEHNGLIAEQGCSKTGFAVVAKLSQYATTKDVYITFKFNPLSEIEGERTIHQGDVWGELGDGHSQITCARIAEHIKTLDMISRLHLI